MGCGCRGCWRLRAPWVEVWGLQQPQQRVIGSPPRSAGCQRGTCRQRSSASGEHGAAHRAERRGPPPAPAHPPAPPGMKQPVTVRPAGAVQIGYPLPEDAGRRHRCSGAGRGCCWDRPEECWAEGRSSVCFLGLRWGPQESQLLWGALSCPVLSLTNAVRSNRDAPVAFARTAPAVQG